MNRTGDPAGGGGVPPSIAAIMAAIRAEVAAPPAAQAAANDASDGEAAEGEPVPAAPGRADRPATEAGDAPADHAPPAARETAGHAPPAGSAGDLLLSDVAEQQVEDAPPPIPAVAAAPVDPAEVRAALAPLLKDWLDGHLPEIVEAAVHAEIRRLTGIA